jgi:pyruvate dehydrogenase E2 component (dihydrolipoamide acetyltransferase)
VRRLARERDIDLTGVNGSGPRGRIIKRDLEGLPSGVQTAAPKAEAAAVGAARRAPVVEKASSMRRTIARRLSESKREIPHYYLTIDVDAEPIVTARKHMNALLEASGEKVSINDLVIKACATALRRMPTVNSSWVDGEMHRHQVVDISVAVAVPDGLITPVVRDADQKGVATIAREVKELAGRAKAKKLAPEEFTGGTFSVTNLGMFGVEDFAAVINPGEGAILAVGAIRDEPVVKGSEVVPGKRMRMTLSADHRIIDGALGAEFLKLLTQLLEAPVAMLV